MRIWGKISLLEKCGYNWFGEVIDHEAVKVVDSTLREITQDIMREMDNPQRKMRLPSPSDENLSPIVTDKLNALILWLMKRNKLHGNRLGKLKRLLK